MKTLIVSIALLFGASAFAATQSLVVFGDSSSEVRRKIDNLVYQIEQTDDRVRGLSKRECNLTPSQKSEGKRLRRKVYSIYMSTNEYNGRVRGVLKVSCK